jgi:hypothetical protein
MEKKLTVGHQSRNSPPFTKPTDSFPVHKSPPLDPANSKRNPAYSLKPTSPIYTYIFQLKIISHPPYNTPTHLILLDLITLIWEEYKL